jgi:hypothetical protein
MLQNAEASSRAMLAHIMREWRSLQPVLGAPPPRGLWILAHEPLPPESLESSGRAQAIQTPSVHAWFGNTDGLHGREVAVAERLRANVTAWGGVPYFRWGWVDFALLATGPVYYLTFLWGGRYGYGLQAAATVSGLVLASEHLWRA